MSSRRHPSAASNRSNRSCSRLNWEVRRASPLQLSLAAAARPASEANLSCNRRRCSLPRRVNPASAPIAASWSAVWEAQASLSARQLSAAWRSLAAATTASLLSGRWAARTLSCSAIARGADGPVPRGRCVRPGMGRAGERGHRRPVQPRPAGRQRHRRGRRPRPGRCYRCGWAGGSGTGRCSPGRRPRRRCRASGRLPRCRPAPRRPCVPRRATGWANRPCGRLARMPSAGS